MIETYTIEQFEIDFQNALDSEKPGILTKAVDCLDVTDDDVRDFLQKYRDELKDIQNDINIDMDKDCNDYINTGIADLYTCIKPFGSEYIIGQDYYVRIIDLASEYREKGVCDVSVEMSNYVNSIKPLIWIISDDGVGTLKKSRVFTSIILNEYFIRK